jgi:N-acetylneuraminic acid mutarotase
LVGKWEKWEPYPLTLAESMGAMVGDDFLIVSGFWKDWSIVTKEVYAYNTKDPNAKWRKMDDVPVPGFTHAAYAVDNLVMYICGAYVGATPGPDSKICLKYDHTAAKGRQWSFLPELPEGRGGGGLNHIKETNSIVYSVGATRRDHKTTDYSTTFELDLDNLSAGWTRRADCPYKGNHVSHVTAYYQGTPHYFWAGGQLEQNESKGNQDDLVEWDQSSKTWIKRADMLFARGHASSSTVAYGCGFIMIGGAINTGTKTSDISYYGVDSNKWTKIGDLPFKMNTPVCDIVRNVAGSDWIYCQTGQIGGVYSWKRRISLI